MNNLSRLLLLVALVVAPLAFGAMETWAKGLVESLIFLSAFFYFSRLIFDSDPRMLKPAGLVPLVVLCGYMFMQFILLPTCLVTLISPSLADLIGKTVGIYSDPQWLAISINRKATLEEFFRFSAYGCAFFLIIQLFSTRIELQKLVKTMVFFGGLIAVHALLQKITADKLIYWFRAAPAKSNPMGPFVYRNHFAGFMEMLFPFAFCLFLYSRPNSVAEKLPLRLRVVHFFQGSTINVHTLYGLAVVVMATAVFVSQSRGGILSLCAATLFMCFMLRRYRLLPGGGLYWMLAPLFVVVFVGMFGWATIAERFLSIQGQDGTISDGRLFIWKDSVGIIADFFLSGAGLGAFADIFPVYQAKSFVGLKIYHAHNDFLEFLATGGLIWSGAFGLFVYLVVKKAAEILSKNVSRWLILMVIAAITAVVSIFFHSLTDFNFFNTANGLYFFVIAGVMLAAVQVAQTTVGTQGLRKTAIGRVWAGVLSLAMLFLLLSEIWFNAGVTLAERNYRQISDIFISASLSANKKKQLLQTSRRLVALDPLENRYWLTKGNIEYVSGKNEDAGASYRKALSLAPASSQTLQQYGAFLLGEGDDSGGKLLKAGVEVDRTSDEAAMRYGRWLLQQGRKEEALKMIAGSFALNHGLKQLRGNLPLLQAYGMNHLEIMEVLPDEIEYRLMLAKYLHDTGRAGEAGEVYEASKDLLGRGKKRLPWHYGAYGYYYSNQKKYAAAIEILTQGVQVFPDDAGLKDQLANNLVRLEKYSLAEIQYREAIRLAPDRFLYHLHLADVLGNLERSKEARAAFSKAIQLFPAQGNKPPGHYRTMIYHCIKNNQFEKALKYAEEGVGAFPRDTSLLNLLANINLRLGRKKRAVEVYKRVLKIDPGNKSALNKLARLEEE